jgi:hypothetical protein
MHPMANESKKKDDKEDKKEKEEGEAAKKQRTREEIAEAIAYWKNQLKEGSCKKLNESRKRWTAHVTSIEWQPNDDGEPKDVFKTADVDIFEEDVKGLLGRIEDEIHSYCNDHSEDGGVDSYDYKITIESSGR